MTKGPLLYVVVALFLVVCMVIPIVFDERAFLLFLLRV